MNDDHYQRDDFGRRRVNRDPQGTTQLDTLFEMLRSPRRRSLLYYLYSTDDEEVPFEDAIRGIQEFEAAGPDSASVESRQSVRTRLLHSDLPKIKQSGMLKYDIRRGTIEFSGDPLLREVLELSSHVELE